MDFPDIESKAFSALVEHVDAKIKGGAADDDLVELLHAVTTTLLKYAEESGISITSSFPRTVESVARVLAARRFGGERIYIRSNPKDQKIEDATVMSLEAWQEKYGASRRYYYQCRKNAVEPRHKKSIS